MHEYNKTRLINIIVDITKLMHVYSPQIWISISYFDIPYILIEVVDIVVLFY